MAHEGVAAPPPQPTPTKQLGEQMDIRGMTDSDGLVNLGLEVQRVHKVHLFKRHYVKRNAKLKRPWRETRDGELNKDEGCRGALPGGVGPCAPALKTHMPTHRRRRPPAEPPETQEEKHGRDQDELACNSDKHC
ncbi:hypothetical protein GN956_G12508 [Arapaima gigas]